MVRSWPRRAFASSQPPFMRPTTLCGPTHSQQSAKNEPCLEFDPFQPTLERALILREAFSITVDLRKQTSGDGLGSNKRKYHSEQHCVNVNHGPSNLSRTW